MQQMWWAVVLLCCCCWWADCCQAWRHAGLTYVPLHSAHAASLAASPHFPDDDTLCPSHSFSLLQHFCPAAVVAAAQELWRWLLGWRWLLLLLRPSRRGVSVAVCQHHLVGHHQSSWLGVWLVLGKGLGMVVESGGGVWWRGQGERFGGKVWRGSRCVGLLAAQSDSLVRTACI